MKKDVIIGVDEVGRGCLAGDLLVCAFAISPTLTATGLEALRSVAMDSKAFSSRLRREAAILQLETAGVFSFARRSPTQIDTMNIRGATLDAMAEAARSVMEALDDQHVVASRVLFDGKDVPDGMAGLGEAVVKGDASVLEISCASMLAKVKRDREMEAAATTWPGYGFERHAGYGTRAHIAGIKRLGLCPIHRSWARKFLDETTVA